MTMKVLSLIQIFNNRNDKHILWAQLLKIKAGKLDEKIMNNRKDIMQIMKHS